MHLRDPEPVCDLGLSLAFEEAQVKDRLLALWEFGDLGRERARYSSVSRCSSSAPSWSANAEESAVVRIHRCIERGEVVGVGDLEPFEHLFLAGPGRSAISATVGERPSSCPSVLTVFRQLEVKLLQSAGHANGPSLVPEVSLQLAHDRRSRVRRELDLALEIETVDRFQQPDGADLDQVLERLTSVAEAAREELDQADVLIDEPLSVLGPLLLVGGFLVRAEECPAPRRDRARCRRSCAPALGQREDRSAVLAVRGMPRRRPCRGSSARTR